MRRDNEPERAIEAYGRGVRTALRNNATAYGFSITITVSYGLLSGAQKVVTSAETISFGLGAVAAFLVSAVVVVSVVPEGSLPEDVQVITISGGADLLSVACAVAAAFGISQLGGFWSWPLTAGGAVVTYLCIGGIGVLIARGLARKSEFGSSQ